MLRALRLAERGWGRVHPNPMVGAVIVRDGVVVGEGYHSLYGGPHAEVVAIEAAHGNTRGATIYVTLEPCHHQGKTPPCTQAIVDAGLSRVVYASADPNPKAAGGAEFLAQHGLNITAGVEVDRADRLNAAFLHVHSRHSPFVALKLALSLDGRIASEPGARTQITGAESQAEVHRLRTGYDAIMVGSGTLLADDPLLTVRGDSSPRVPPVRIILDSSLQTPATSAVFRSIDQAPLMLVASEKAPAARQLALAAAGATILTLPPGPDGAIPIPTVLDALWHRGIRTVLCEGGARLATSFLEAGVLRRIQLFFAPVVLGPSAVPAFESAIALSAAWGEPECRTFGRDVCATWDRVD